MEEKGDGCKVLCKGRVNRGSGDIPGWAGLIEEQGNQCRHKQKWLNVNSY